MLIICSPPPPSPVLWHQSPFMFPGKQIFWIDRIMDTRIYYFIIMTWLCTQFNLSYHKIFVIEYRRKRLELSLCIVISDSSVPLYMEATGIWIFMNMSIWMYILASIIMYSIPLLNFHLFQLKVRSSVKEISA